MKKIVPRLFVISSQVLLGTLFLIISIHNKEVISYKVNSKEMDKLSWVIYDSSDSLVSYEEDILTDNDSDNVINDNDDVIIDNNVTYIEEDIVEEDSVSDNFFMDKEVLNTYYGSLTGYGPDCYGCGNYVTNKVSTSSGYHIANIVDGVIEPAFTITYDDYEYGNVRIVAGDSSLPYKSIVRINIDNEDPIIAIVLDRGSTVGFDNCRSGNGCLTTFDLLYETEGSARGKVNNVKFEILRIGG